MRFDLSNLRNLPAARAQLTLKWAGLGFLIVFPIVGAAGIGYGLYTHPGLTGWMPSFAVLLGLTIMFTAFGALFLRGSRCVAVGLDVDGEGFSFDFGRGQPWAKSWSDPGLRLQVATLIRADGTWAYVLLSEGPFRRAFVTPEAYADFTKYAQGFGLRMSSRTSRRSPALVLTSITR